MPPTQGFTYQHDFVNASLLQFMLCSPIENSKGENFILRNWNVIDDLKLII